MAQQMLLKYLNLRQRYPLYFMNIDCLNQAVNEIVDAGYLFVSPFRDNHGRRVIIGTASKLTTIIYYHIYFTYFTLHLY